MTFLQWLAAGFAFGLGICLAFALLTVWLRASSAKTEARRDGYMKETADLLRSKVAELKRIADVMEFWAKRERDKEFHG